MAKKGTDVKIGEYKGNPTVSIIEVDQDGKQINEHPVITFGKRKLKAILENTEKLQEAYEKM